MRRQARNLHTEQDADPLRHKNDQDQINMAQMIGIKWPTLTGLA